MAPTAFWAVAFLWLAALCAGGPAGPSNKLPGVVSSRNVLAAARLVGRPATRQQAASVAPLLKKLLDAGIDSTLRVYFGQWKETFGKSYGSRAEETKRYGVWKINLRAILLRNIDLGSTQWRTLTPYSDLTKAEAAASLLIKTLDMTARNRAMAAAATAGKVFTPQLSAMASDAVNWVAQGKVTPAKNQLHCGSCWAYAAVAAIESRYLIQTAQSNCAKTIDLSEQELVSCTPRDLATGCQGAWGSGAFQWLARGNKLALEGAYPYQSNHYATCCSRDDPDCPRSRWCSDFACDKSRYSSAKVGASVTDIGFVKKRSATALMQALKSIGPLVVYVCADAWDSSYAGGIVTAQDCWCDTPGGVNHAVTLVGYDARNGVGHPSSHWIIKNSWGPEWGSNGYIFLQMTPDGTNGVCNLYLSGADYPITSFKASDSLTRTRSTSSAKPSPSSGQAQSSPKTINVAQGSYTIADAYRDYSGDYKWTDSVAANTSAKCAAACFKAPRCRYFTLLGDGWALPGIGAKNCLMVDGGATPTARDNIYGAKSGVVVKRAAAAAPAPAGKTTDFDVVPKFREYSGAKWFMAIATESALQCGEACVAQPKCGLFTWVGSGFSFAVDGLPNCMLVDRKAKVTIKRSSFTAMSGTVTAQRAERPPVTTAAAGNKRTCNTIKDVDFSGGDLFNAPHPTATTAAECCTACSATPGCAVWTLGFYNRCWLKKASGWTRTAVAGYGVISGKVEQAAAGRRRILAGASPAPRSPAARRGGAKVHAANSYGYEDPFESSGFYFPDYSPPEPDYAPPGDYTGGPTTYEAPYYAYDPPSDPPPAYASDYATSYDYAPPEYSGGDPPAPADQYEYLAVDYTAQEYAPSDYYYDPAPPAADAPTYDYYQDLYTYDSTPAAPDFYTPMPDDSLYFYDSDSSSYYDDSPDPLPSPVPSAPPAPEVAECLGGLDFKAAVASGQRVNYNGFKAKLTVGTVRSPPPPRKRPPPPRPPPPRPPPPRNTPLKQVVPKGATARLACPKGQVLSAITSPALFGCANNAKGKAPAVGSSLDVTALLSARCLGKVSCSIQSTVASLGQLASCTASKLPAFLSASAACSKSYKPPAALGFTLPGSPEGSDVVLECPPKSTFTGVTSARYGLASVCADTTAVAKAIKTKCVGKAACKISVTKAVLGDPCHNKKPKLLTAKLACSKPAG